MSTKFATRKNVTLYRYGIGWALRAWLRGYVWLCVGGGWGITSVRKHQLASKDMLWRFARRRHRIFRPVVLSPLSIIYHPFTLQIVLLHSLNFATIFGEEENFARCINLFWKSTPSDTTINPSGIGWCLKDDDTVLLHDDTATDRPRGFGIVARTKFPRRGGKRGCGRRPLN